MGVHTLTQETCCFDLYTIPVLYVCNKHATPAPAPALFPFACWFDTVFDSKYFYLFSALQMLPYLITYLLNLA